MQLSPESAPTWSLRAIATGRNARQCGVSPLTASHATILQLPRQQTLAGELMNSIDRPQRWDQAEIKLPLSCSGNQDHLIGWQRTAVCNRILLFFLAGYYKQTHQLKKSLTFKEQITGTSRETFPSRGKPEFCKYLICEKTLPRLFKHDVLSSGRKATCKHVQQLLGWISERWDLDIYILVVLPKPFHRHWNCIDFLWWLQCE